MILLKGRAFCPPFFLETMANFKDKLVKRLLGHATRRLGEKVEYRYVNGGVKQIDAVFDNEFEQVDPDTERVVSTNQPVIGIRLSDIAREPVVNDEVYIIRDNKTYKVQDTQEDGQGGVTLFLRLKTRRTSSDGREGLLR